MRYISVIEYLMGRATLETLPKEIVGNINTLIPKINELLEAFGEYRACTSGFRTPEDQARINPKAPHSNHLTGSAIDLADADGQLNAFCKKNVKLLEKLGLYCENRQGNWQHLQIVKPRSGSRFFNP